MVARLARAALLATALVLGCGPGAEPAAPAPARPARPAVVLASSQERTPFLREGVPPTPPAVGRPPQTTSVHDGGVRRPGELAAAPLAAPPRTAGPAAGLPAASVYTPAPGRSTTPDASTTPRAAPTPSTGAPTRGTPTPGREETVYPTPTLRPAHPPSTGPFIIPRASLPNIRDHAPAAGGFLRADSITPVPVRRDPTPPNAGAAPDQGGDQAAPTDQTTDGSP
ncbi:MAG TPA: hypothetical protein VFC93_09435 [Chloroflexota bacterium]|nr:hypothetical protein [Chloroflexota bacterium]